MTINKKPLERRILYISKKLGLSHIGSCLSCLPVLTDIYEGKGTEDIVLMDNGHASLAHYVVLEALGGKDAIEMFHKHGVHANRDIDDGLWGSNGSLGHGIGIGIGYALADKTRNVYVIVSDGSTQEGSTFEALRIAKSLNLTNLKIYANFNSYTAVAQIDLDYWEKCLSAIGFPIKFRRTNNGLPELDGVNGHYMKLP